MPAYLNALYQAIAAQQFKYVVGPGVKISGGVPSLNPVTYKFAPIITDKNAPNYNTKLDGPSQSGALILPFNSVPQQINECAPASVANSLQFKGVMGGATNIPSPIPPATLNLSLSLYIGSMRK